MQRNCVYMNVIDLELNQFNANNENNLVNRKVLQKVLRQDHRPEQLSRENRFFNNSNNSNNPNNFIKKKWPLNFRKMAIIHNDRKLTENNDD